MTYEQWVKIAKFAMGGMAVVAAFLLAQPDVVIPDLLKVALGAFLAFAAYANPASLIKDDAGTDT